MNTVLLSTAPDNNASLKAKPARQPSDSASPAGEASGFAGILASQTPAQAQNAVAPGTTNVSGTATEGGTSTASQTQAGLQQSGHSPQDSKRAAVDTKADGNVRLGHDKHATLLDPASVTLADSKPNHGTDRDEATLPQRFAQIIAAMDKTGGRHTVLPQDSKNAETRPAVTPETAAETAPANARARVDSRAERQLPADGFRLNANRNTAKLSGIADQARPGIEGKLVAGQFADDTNPTSFILNESHRAQPESRAGSVLHGSIASPDSILNAAVTSPALGPVAGAAHSSDVMANSATINPPLFSKQWGPEMGRQFVSLIRPGENGSHIAELRLDPPELGPLRVMININDSVVQAMFTSAHANVRSAVEQALPQLQQQLEQEGLSLGQTSVGHDDGTSGTHPELAGSRPSGHQHKPEVSTTSTPTRQRVPDALVDTFA